MPNSSIAPVQLAFEGDAAIPEDAETEASSEAPVQLEGLDGVLAQTAVIFQSGYTLIGEYARTHTMTVLIAGAIALVLVLAFICDSDFRCTSDMRIRRRRKQEEKVRKRREEEIERMTTAEIEAELRQVWSRNASAGHRSRAGIRIPGSSIIPEGFYNKNDEFGISACSLTENEFQSSIFHPHLPPADLGVYQ